MGKLKAILAPMADAAKTGRKVPGAASDLLNPHLPKGDLGQLDNLAEYQDAASALEKVNDVPPSTGAVQQEIALRRAEAAEQHRVKALAPDFTDVDYDAQALTPDEFKPRVRQLTNPESSIRAREKSVFQANISSKEAIPSEVKLEAADQYARWEGEASTHSVADNPVLSDWAKEGAYTRKDVFGDDVLNADEPVVFYRMDIRQDPREELSPIQFDADANEFGMHVGSKAAGQHIISETVTEMNSNRLKSIKDMFDELTKPLADEGIDPVAVYEQAFNEVRTNAFLRYGEKAFDEPALEIVNDIIDDFFEELVFIANSRNIDGFEGLSNSTAFKTRLRSQMRMQFDPLQHPLVTDAKQGLLVKDLGPKNTAAGYAEDLLGRGIFDDDELTAVMQMRNAEANTTLRNMLREKGYDHLVYVSEAEDAGVISLVLLDEANYQNLYKPTKGRNGAPNGHKASVNAVMAPLAAVLGVGGASIRTEK